MVVKPWEQRDRSITEILPEVQARLSAIPGLQIFAARPPALPGGGNFPVEFIIASTAEPERMLELAQQLQTKAMESGVFNFPPEIDLKYDQPQSEIVIDYQKVAMLGLNNAQIGADLAAALGGDYVNRFNIAGRAYKVIPQIARTERLNRDQLKDI
jgi:multidrug efflux pump